eukprot:jgi/Ulvmu1/1532/UM011_0262.1
MVMQTVRRCTYGSRDCLNVVRRASSISVGAGRKSEVENVVPACFRLREINETSSILPFEDRIVHIQRGLWDIKCTRDTWIVTGCIRVTSRRPQHELFLPQVQCKAETICRQAHPESATLITQHVKIGQAQSVATNMSPDEILETQPLFWAVPILKHGEELLIPVRLTLAGGALTHMTDVWVQLLLDVYGPHGLVQQQQDIVLPVKCPPVAALDSQEWSDCPYLPGAQALPVKTHLLCHLDDPASVVEQYAAEVARLHDGPVVCIAESALAIMQGRWRHYNAIQPSFLARLGCRLFSPLSSMASACGLQAAIYLVGPLRVAAALILGSIARLVGIRGLFYRIVGKAATAIDDLTGTLAPFDRFVVFGPTDPDDAVRQVEERTGLRAAVVDVNDLSAHTGGVSVLSHSQSVNAEDLKRAILHNPAGNGDQQTPILVIRGMPRQS